MPNYRRLYVPGGDYFFTVCLRDRSSDLLVREITALRAAWAGVAARRPFETLAAVVLPDHIHAVWRLPEGDHDFSTRWRLIKHGFTARLSSAFKHSRRKGARDIWQPRFWEHFIRNETDFDNHVGYVHGNPVKHGFALRPDDWPYSTWKRWRRDTGRPWAPPPPMPDVHEP